MHESELIQLMDDHGDYLMKVAYVYLKNWSYAEEAVQDVFQKFYMNAQQFEGKSSVRTYLVKMTMNRSYDYLRSWRYKKAMLLHGLQNKEQIAPDSIEYLFEQRLKKSVVVQQLLSLKPASRDVLVLYYFEDLSVKEIAELLELSESTVKTRLFRARDQLKASFTKEQLEVLKNG